MKLSDANYYRGGHCGDYCYHRGFHRQSDTKMSSERFIFFLYVSLLVCIYAP